MDLVEIRDLDGPNLFATYPVIKLDMVLSQSDTLSDNAVSVLGTLLPDVSHSPDAALARCVGVLHQQAGLTTPEIGWYHLDDPDRRVLFFAWEWRESALQIARMAYDAVAGTLSGFDLEHLRKTLAHDQATGNSPLWIRDIDRRLPAVGITGTNGKTTTTRVLSHLLRTSGKHVGWSSTSGVYIDGEQVLEGDYTGPSGARRVLEDPGVDVAVLETARGGILLRGLAYESNDVGVFLNVSDDHLDMQGIGTLDTLAKVKSIVVRVTKADGLVVLNADDPRVLAVQNEIRAPVLLTSQHPDENAAVVAHIAGGGEAIVRRGQRVVHVQYGTEADLFALDDAPMTFGGRAGHMVENLLAAVGAALGLGMQAADIIEGVRSFRTDRTLNQGRLNAFDVYGTLVVIDYAHNESGLEALIALGRQMIGTEGALRVIIGTAGDRRDDVFRALGRIAVSTADRVYIKETPRYLRGRGIGDASALMREGAEQTEFAERIAGLYDDEVHALLAALDDARSGDIIVAMSVEQQAQLYDVLQQRGACEWRGVVQDET